MSNDELYVAIDVDVVDTWVALVNPFGQIKGDLKKPSHSFKEDRGIKSAIAIMQELLKSKSVKPENIRGIGISTPMLEVKMKDRSTVLPFLYMAHFKHEFPNTLVRAAADVTLMALAEFNITYQSAPKSLYYLNWGSGIGGGIVLNGRIWPGAHGVASNIGHLPIKGVGMKCWCGHTDCLTTYAAGEILPIHYFKMLESMKPKNYKSPFEGKSQKDVTFIDIMKASAAGDVIATKVFDMATTAMAKALSIVVNLFNPELILIGGAVAGASSDLVNMVSQKTKTDLMFPETHKTAIVPSKIHRAGLLGAYQFVFANAKAQQGKKVGKALKAVKK